MQVGCVRNTHVRSVHEPTFLSFFFFPTFVINLCTRMGVNEPGSSSESELNYATGRKCDEKRARLSARASRRTFW